MTVLPNLVTLVEAADHDRLPNAFQLLRVFPDLQAALPPAAVDRLRACVQNNPVDGSDLRAFEATAIPVFEADAVEKFMACERAVQSAILARFADPAFWPAAMDRLANAGSFRGAEALFTEFAVPFEAVANADHLSQLLGVIMDNGQIEYAGGIPVPLAAFAQSVAERHIIHPDQAMAFIAHLDERNRRASYEELIEVFEKAGVALPNAPEEDV